MAKILPILCALLVSCAAPDPTITSAAGAACDERMNLNVDSLFTEVERVEVLKAVSNWRTASGSRICFQITWRDTSKDKETFRSDGRFTVYSWRGPWQVKAAVSTYRKSACLGVTIWEHGGQTSDVFVVTREHKYLRALVTHELGHVFGLRHTAVYDSIMYESIRPDKTISQIDRKNLDCLLKTRTFLNHENDCVYTK